jgi:hypothetical protein
MVALALRLSTLRALRIKRVLGTQKRWRIFVVSRLRTRGSKPPRTSSACRSARAPTTARTTSLLASSGRGAGGGRCDAGDAAKPAAGAACGAPLSSAAMRAAVQERQRGIFWRLV